MDHTCVAWVLPAAPDVAVLASELHHVQLVPRQHPAAALNMVGVHPRFVSALHTALLPLLHLSQGVVAQRYRLALQLCTQLCTQP